MNKTNKFNISKFILLVLLVVLLTSIVGCEQVSNLKDNTVNKFNEWKESDFFHESAISTTNETITTTMIIPTTTKITPITTTTPKPVYKNPSWQELVFFLQDDKTDLNTYNDPIFVCQDFAEMVQDNAHKAGWRCAVVTIRSINHACNAFETTDRGFIFIDCTGLSPYETKRPFNCDKVVEVIKGQHFVPVSLFPEPGWKSTWEDMGIVDDYTLSW
jgi:hypothetical protein